LSSLIITDLLIFLTMPNPWLELPKIIALFHRDRKAMEAYQERQLIRLIRDLYHGNEFYRRLWDEAGFKLNEFKGREDLAMLPLVTKQQIRNLGKTLLEKPPGGGRLVWHNTSGSSGENLKIARSWHEERFLAVVRKWALRSLGFRGRQRMGRIRVPAEFDWLSDLPLRVLNKLGYYRSRVISCFDEPELAWKNLSEYQPDSITGYPESVARIARYGLDSGLSDVRPEVVGVGGERCTPLMRRQISEAFQAPIYETYGSTEFDTIAWSCPKSDLLHIFDPKVIVEVLDQDGNPVAEGERGQAIATGFHSRIMPFVRYVLGDQVVKGPTPCTCGAPFGTLKSIDGREMVRLMLANGKSLHGFVLLDEVIEGDTTWMRQYQLVQNEPGVIELRIAPLSRPDPDVLERLTSHLEKFTAGTVVQIKLVEEMELDQSGKFHLCKCNLK